MNSEKEFGKVEERFREEERRSGLSGWDRESVWVYVVWEWGKEKVAEEENDKEVNIHFYRE